MNTKYYHSLYFSEGLTKDRAKIRKQIKMDENIKSNQIEDGLYVVTLAQSEENNLEFFKVSNLRQDSYNLVEVFVIGFAKSYNEAKELVVEIVNEVLEKTNGLEVRKYLLDTERKNVKPRRDTKKPKETRLSKVRKWVSNVFFR